MKLHGNARTCLHSRLLMVRRLEEEGWTLAPDRRAATSPTHAEPLNALREHPRSLVSRSAGSKRPALVERGSGQGFFPILNHLRIVAMRLFMG